MTWILTHTGKKFFPLDPNPSAVDIEDIAHALSNICRFTGHSNHFYSVAEHSLFVADLLPRHLKLAGLLHDASEAYICDVASPVKPYLVNYAAAEDALMSAVGKAFGVEKELFHHSAVKHVDKIAGYVEMLLLMPNYDIKNEILGPEEKKLAQLYADRLYIRSRQETKAAFLNRYKELTQ